jgi:NitT/TauT family transport system substrate-binding protein
MRRGSGRSAGPIRPARRGVLAAGGAALLGLGASSCAAYRNHGRPPGGASDGGNGGADGGGSGGSPAGGRVDPGKPGSTLTMGLTYIPNVQFAPYYVADQQGYFADAGVDVTLRHHGQDEDLFGALAGGTEQVVVAGADEMMQNRDHDLDVVAFQTVYQKYSVCLVVREDSDIHGPDDLKGKTLATPGKMGETWMGLLALLDQAGLTEDDVTVETIGYTQQAALTSKKADGVMGFVNNDVPQFRSTGLAVRAVPLEDVPLVGISLGASGPVVQERADELGKVAAAVKRAVQAIIKDPQLAIDATTKAVPGVVDADQEKVMRATVEATIPLFGKVGSGWGVPDLGKAKDMSAFMHDARLTSRQIPADEATTDQIPAG